MKIRYILLCFILLLPSCAARVKDQVTRDAREGRCEQAVAVFEKNAVPEKVWRKTKQIGGATASGAATGVVALTETTIFVLPGVAAGVVICSPIIVLEAAAKGDGNASARCITVFGAAGIALFRSKEEDWIANRVWKNTESWRLESYDDLSRMLRGIAQCYADRNTPESLKTAQKQVLSIRESIWDGLTVEEKEQVDLLSSDVRTRLKSVKKEAADR